MQQQQQLLGDGERRRIKHSVRGRKQGARQAAIISIYNIVCQNCSITIIIIMPDLYKVVVIVLHVRFTPHQEQLHSISIHSSNGF